MKRKVVILGGRSGSSLMLRLIEAAGYKAWTHKKSTEPKIAPEIYKDPTDKDKIRELLSFSDWDVAKLPEFGFCIKELKEIHDPIFIWMQRPLEDRVKSHKRLGWDKSIRDRCNSLPKLREYIKGNTSLHYFNKLDELNQEANSYKIDYRELNLDFKKVMLNLANHLNIDYESNIARWLELKQKPQQSGSFK